MVRFFIRRVVALAVLAQVLVVTQDASAQVRRRFFAVPMADLASLEQVQTELKYSDEQKAKIVEIAGQFQSDRRALAQEGSQQGAGEQMLQKMALLDRESSAKVLDLLDKTQRERLLGISIQINGAKALYEPAVTQALHFTKEQDEKLELTRTDIRNIFRNAFIQFGSMSEGQRRAKVNELVEEGDEKLMGVMSTAQRKKFDELSGEAIDVDLSPLPWARPRN
jgi:hypothetical protein